MNLTHYGGHNYPKLWIKLKMKNEFYPQFSVILPIDFYRLRNSTISELMFFKITMALGKISIVHG
jgi:hypothetical protein